MTTEKLKMHSPDFTRENIAKLAELFPNCVTESRAEDGKLKRAIDFDQLRQELSTSIVEGSQERYHLNWPGKRDALLTANAPIAKTLRPCREESVDFDTTKNLFIEGDNLDALKLLQETYLNKVKMIYIDPPYNTGNDFIYEDDFAEDSETYFVRSNQKDEIGNRLVPNTEANGRFHSDWLTMMYSRLRLARRLLTDDGIILVSIGPEEVKNTISLLNEIFGEENNVSIITWEKGRKNDSTFFSESVEYLVAYSKNRPYLASLGKWREPKEGGESILNYYEKLRADLNGEHVKIEESMKSFYSHLKESDPRKQLSHFWRSDDRGLFFGADISSASTSIPDYEIIHPFTKRNVKKPSRGWGATEPVMLERIKNNEVLFGENETTIPLKKSYLKDVDSNVKTPVIYKDGRAASGVLKKIFGEVIFNNPKDHEVLADHISYCLQSNINAIILDFFAGSGTLAHSVIQMNKLDGGNRRFILVQLPEALDVSKATSPSAKVTIKKAIEFLHSIGRPLNIAEIAKERIRRVGKSIKYDIVAEGLNENLDIGFRVLKIDSSNMKDVYYAPDAVKQGDLLEQVDNIREDRTSEDLLFQVLLDWGVDLTLSITQETISGKKVFFVDGNALAACFETGINEEFVKAMAARHPMRAVFRDTSFNSDSVKINIEQIFKLISPATEVKTL
jgi:adenine-specific DNA-methyltransferase